MDEEYATDRRRPTTRSTTQSPDSHDCSPNRSGSPQILIEEPFFSSLSYIQQQQQRLDSESIGSNSSTARFRCAPRYLDMHDDDDDGDDNNDEGRLGASSSAVKTSSTQYRDYASRFLETSLDQDEDDEEAERSKPATHTINDDLFGFLMGNHGEKQNHDSNSNMWDHHSQRGTAVDQSINLMDTTVTNYENENRGRRSPTAKPSHLQALKQPFALILQPSPSWTTHRSSSANVARGREIKPLVDIELDNWNHRHYSSGSTSSQKETTLEKLKVMAFLAILLVLVSSCLAFIAAPKHSQQLFGYSRSSESVLLINDTALNGKARSDDDENLAGFLGNNTTLIEAGADSTGESTAEAIVVNSVTTNTGAPIDKDDIVSTSQIDADFEALDDAMLKLSGSVEIQSRTKENSAKETSDLLLEGASGSASNASSISSLLEMKAFVPQWASRMEAIQYYLEELEVSDPEDLKEPMKAANKALQWISDEDGAQLLVPGYDKTSNVDDEDQLTQILQRYAMAVLFYEMESGFDDNEYDKRYEHATDTERSNRDSFDQSWRDRTRFVCEWYGVTCEDNQIVALNVTSSLLMGTLPMEILAGVALPRMTSLDFSHNYIVGELPKMLSFARWEGYPLTQLRLQHNHIRGHLDQVAGFKNLTHLDVSFNDFNGGLPSNIDVLQQLEFLSVYHNGLGGGLPSMLGNLMKLTSLYLDEGGFLGTVPSELGRLVNLVDLRLLDNGLTGTVPSEVCDLLVAGKLEKLIADCNSMHGKISCDCCTLCWRD